MPSKSGRAAIGTDTPSIAVPEQPKVVAESVCRDQSTFAPVPPVPTFRSSDVSHLPAIAAFRARFPNHPSLVADRALDPAVVAIGSAFGAVIAALGSVDGGTLVPASATYLIATFAAAAAGEPSAIVAAAGALDTVAAIAATSSLRIALAAAMAPLGSRLAAALAAALIFLRNDRKRYRQGGHSGEQHQLTHG